VLASGAQPPASVMNFFLVVFIFPSHQKDTDSSMEAAHCIKKYHTYAALMPYLFSIGAITPQHGCDQIVKSTMVSGFVYTTILPQPSVTLKILRMVLFLVKKKLHSKAI
jgi:hypothetical protein